MEARRHPSYPHESRHLSDTIEALRQEQSRMAVQYSSLKETIEELMRSTGGDYNEELVNKSILFEGVRSKLGVLPYALNKPYFARLDFREDGRDGEEIYLGKMGIQHEGRELIVDWRAPVANIYYCGQMGRVSFKAPSRILGDLVNVGGDLMLKRQFIIDRGALVHIFDRETSVQDELLQAVLESGSEQRLKEIVSTIQAEQNAIIRADRDQVLIAQGVAGSGKTTVALHRLAYLVYTFQRELPPERILIVGPNELFLTYISEVLPELGVDRVRQATFARLALSLIGQDIDVTDRGLRLLETGNDLHESGVRLARFKGSLGMQRVIEGYARHLEQNMLPEGGLMLEGETVVSRDELQSYQVRECGYLPLMARFTMVRNFCRQRLKREADRRVAEARAHCDREVLRLKAVIPDGGERRWRIGCLYDERDAVVARLGKGAVPSALDAYMKRWPKWTLLELYHRLFDDPALVSEWSEGALMTERAAEYAVQFAGERSPGTVLTDDLAPLVHLQGLVFGFRNFQKPHHIVVDEAQDLSLFQFSILKSLSANGSFTVVGDMAQAVHPYRGLKDWDELTEIVFADAPRLRLGLTKSYRSATEIMHLANALIAQSAGRFAPAEPVLRHCPRPKLLRGFSRSSTWKAIPDLIRSLQDDGCKSVALIGRTARECEELHAFLSGTLACAPQLVTDSARDYESNVVIIPVSSAKGLEFDGVILTDVSDRRYHQSELDVKLMYVACTRAMHRLLLLCPGAETPMLNAVGGDVLDRVHVSG